MGLLNKLFNIDKGTDNAVNVRVDNKKQPIMVNKEISAILDILSNLGLMNKEKIEKLLQSGDFTYDSSILNRLMIQINKDDIKQLKKYLEHMKLGYGSVKLFQIKDKLNDIAATKEKEGKNKAEIVEELIHYAKSEIDAYKQSLIAFNATIKQVEDTSESESEVHVMTDYWVNYYKEQLFGYPVDIDTKVETMALDLQFLPYGGYSTSEVDKFIEAAQQIIAEDKKNGVEPNYTHNRIVNSLFNPKKQRYMTDLESLKTKLSRIESSNSLNSRQKIENKARAIDEFRVRNGHEQKHYESSQLNSTGDNYTFLIEINIEKLVSLDGGGYGSSAIASYRKDCQNIIASDMEEADKYIQINKKAQALVKMYNHNHKIFNKWRQEQLEKVAFEDRDNQKLKLDEQVKYMLSLSPSALDEYYIEDSKTKKEAADKQNFMTAFKYLAKKEAMESRDDSIYEQRLNDLQNGINPYSDEEINDAITQLEILSITDDGDENNIVSSVAYIDSTLIKQLLSIEQSQRHTIPLK